MPSLEMISLSQNTSPLTYKQDEQRLNFVKTSFAHCGSCHVVNQLTINWFELHRVHSSSSTQKPWFLFVLRTFLLIGISDLKQNTNMSTAFLTVCRHFPESVLNAESQYIAYYNNSYTGLTLPTNTSIGQGFEWDLSETVTRENPDVINCHFAVSEIIPSLKFVIATGLTALQYMQSLLSGQVFYINPKAIMLQPLSANTYLLLLSNVDAFSLLPPLEQTFDVSSKFSSDAVNINTIDNITQPQIRSLKDILQEFPSLWEDRISHVIEPEED